MISLSCYVVVVVVSINITRFRVFCLRASGIKMTEMVEKKLVLASKCSTLAMSYTNYAI